MATPNRFLASVTPGVLLLSAFAFAAAGCATKKFVNNRIDPLAQRLETLEGQSKEHAQSIGELETAVSRADERAVSAGHRADQAAESAAKAGAGAQQAAQAAQGATSLAEKALAGVDTIEGRLAKLHDYRVASQEAVLFDFESSRLTDQAKQQLDAAAARLAPEAPYLIEVRGFTDTSGSAPYNLELSERRAQAVVRYLTSRHGIPLHRIFVLGLGSEEPAADNTTRDGRRLNRRVEVKVYVPAGSEAVAARR